MKRINWVGIILPLIVLLVASLACDVPGSSDNENKDGDLAATETMKALATEVAGTLAPDDGENESSEAEEPKAPEGEPAEPSVTPTTSATPLPDAPMVSVSADTNCRSGPGDVYDYKGALLVGEEALVTGKLANESFWYIENPDAPPPYCWIWGMYASVSGDKSGIPILTPPPTPTPANSPTPTLTYTPTPDPMNFVAIFQTFRIDCTAIFVRIKNTGSVDLESSWVSVHVPQTGSTLSGSRDYFADTPLCGYAHIDKIPPGAHEYIMMGPFQSINGTRTYEITIKICTEEGLGGVCKQTYIEETIEISL